MGEIWEGVAAAIALVASLDPALIEITLRSLQVTLSAVAVAGLIGIPLGAFLAVARFPGRGVIVATLTALMGLPPVVVGLLVYLFLSQAGPFGVLNLLFTPWAMVIAQIIIVTPLVASISLQAIAGLWEEYRDLLRSLGATSGQRMRTLIWDGRGALVTAMLAGFGRAIGEVGAVMIVGGNIDNATRVLTTAIALETSKGNFALALGLGIVLLALALLVNLLSHGVGRTEARALP
ncbi:MAG: ABC transporter permease [Pseudomonadota bacterium]